MGLVGRVGSGNLGVLGGRGLGGDGGFNELLGAFLNRQVMLSPLILCLKYGSGIAGVGKLCMYFSKVSLR